MAESNCEGESKHLQLEVTATQNIVPHTDTFDAIPTTDYAMLSDIVKSVMNLNHSNYLKVFWDTIRCLYLLWKIGITHGDVSLANTMYKDSESEQEIISVLNDSDLATVMKLTCRSPGKKGRERTGTLPFMALDLLRFYDGQIKMWFRHDLESGTWCLTWHMVYEESEHRKWYTGTFKNIYYRKRVLLDEFQRSMIKEDWRDYFHFMGSWLSEWSRIHREMNLRTGALESETKKFEEREKYNEEQPDEEFIRTAVDLARKCGLDNVDALTDTSWIGVQLQNT